MMKKIYILVFLLLLCLQNKAFAYDCELDKIKTGADVNELKKVGILVFGQDQYGGSMLMLPIEDVCKNSDGVEGIILNLFFIKNKLVQISFENLFSEKQILFDIANNIYKANLEKNEAKSKNNETEIYSTTQNDNFFFYAFLRNEDQHSEYLEITSNKHRDKISEYFLKREGQ